MKLRNKLAAVLATAMVVTSVPVVTMAYSSNSITREGLLQAENEAFRDETTAPAIRIELKSKKLSQLSSTNKEVFYVTLDNADWLGSGDTIETSAGDIDDVVVRGKDGQKTIPGVDGNALEGTSSDIKITRESDSRIKVELTGANRPACFGTEDDVLYIPLMIKLGEGEAKVSLETMGSSSTISEGNWVIADTSDAVATAKAGTVTSFNKDGKIADITITEAYKNSMKMSGTNHNYALLELDDTDFKFDMTQNNATKVGTGYYAHKKDGDVRFFNTSSTNAANDKTYTCYNLKAEYSYGFGDSGLSTVVVYVDDDDASTMYVELPNNLNADSQGVIKLKNLYVKSSVKSPAEGELTLDVSADVEETNDLVVAKVGDYTATITVKDDKVIDIIGGQDEEVEYTLKEAVDGTFTDTREIDFTLENGYFAEAILDKNGDADEDATLAAVQSGDIIIIKKLEQKKNSDTLMKYKDSEIQKAITDVEIDDNDRVIGFTIKPQHTFEANKLDSFVFTSDIRAGLDQSGDIKLTAKSRDLEEAVSGVIGNAITPVTVETEAALLKTGLKDQLAGKITITEADKAILQKGEKLTLFFEDATGISISTNSDEKPEVKVTSGDLQIDEVKVTTAINKDGDTVPAVTVEIKRASKEASTLEISNFHFDVDRTAAQGSYDVQIGGKALSDFEVTYTGSSNNTYKAPADAIVVEDFVVNGTPNTQDIGVSNGLAKGTITFEIGKTTYTAIDGTEKTMDAAAFIQDPGYTMIPVRYVAEAFGVDTKDIVFSNGTATIFAGTRTIQLTNGSNIAVVNGAQVTMGTKVIIKDGRTYAPVGEIATILGLKKDWNSSTKVATFVNE